MITRNHFIPDIPFNQGRLVGFLVMSFSSTANRHDFLYRLLYCPRLPCDFRNAALNHCDVGSGERVGRDFRPSETRLDGRKGLPDHFLLGFDALQAGLKSLRHLTAGFEQLNALLDRPSCRVIGGSR